MNICYYCEKKEAAGTRFGAHACIDCKEADIRMIHDPQTRREMTDSQKARQLKIMMEAFKDAFSEDDEDETLKNIETRPHKPI